MNKLAAPVLALIAATACLPGRNTADRISGPPKLEIKGETKCGVAKSQSEPLVIEWTSSDRSKLEALASKGTVVVAYEGCEMHVLAQCRAPGKYTYAGTTRKRDLISINDADELYANIPVGAAKLEGKLQTSGQLNVSMTIVGRYETAKPIVQQSELDGACEGATHVVAALTTGAFKFFAGNAGEVGGGASFVGAGAGAKSISKTELLNEDGDESSCAKSSSKDSAPPDGCGAILRVEVVPLGKSKSATPTCAPGTTWDGAQCHHDAPKHCLGDDAADCQKQCDVGDMFSCAALGWLHQYGRGGAALDKAKALKLGVKTCDAGQLWGCFNVGMMHYSGDGVAADEKKAVALFTRACEGRVADACAMLGDATSNGKGGVAADKSRAAVLYQRACDDASAYACTRLGRLYAAGTGVTENKPKAVALYQRGCDGGNAEGCYLVGFYTYYGVAGVTENKTKGVQLFQRACDGDDAEACYELGAAHALGKGGLKTDPKTAAALYKRACDGNSGSGCGSLAMMTMDGEGGLTKDPAAAVKLYQRGCDLEDWYACRNLGFTYENGRGGIPVDKAKATALYDRACKGGNGTACEDAKRIKGS